jgi:hypothetical protein
MKLLLTGLIFCVVVGIVCFLEGQASGKKNMKIVVDQLSASVVKCYECAPKCSEEPKE